MQYKSFNWGKHLLKWSQWTWMKWKARLSGRSWMYINFLSLKLSFNFWRTVVKQLWLLVEVRFIKYRSRADLQTVNIRLRAIINKIKTWLSRALFDTLSTPSFSLYCTELVNYPPGIYTVWSVNLFYTNVRMLYGSIIDQGEYSSINNLSSLSKLLYVWSYMYMYMYEDQILQMNIK